MEKKTITLIQKKIESTAVELPVVAVSPNEDSASISNDGNWPFIMHVRTLYGARIIARRCSTY
jgi:hypothetical protein